MKVEEVFATDVTRDIPPVIYFHEQSPEKLAAEVSEYIITGGYEPGDPRRQRIDDGIHEQFVHLLTHVGKELKKDCDLPACWISGFFGSGKSSFAKLLGYALDHRQLPDGRSLAQALLERDDSPRRAHLHQAWKEAFEGLSTMAVVFDIGAAARDDEHVHSAVKRKVQARLGYCEASSAVAEFELKLESDGHWQRFLQACEEVLQRPWSQVVSERLVEDHFSRLMSHLFPETYEDPLSWLDLHSGSLGKGGASVEDTVHDIQAMLVQRAPGKTVFLVVDEVSQYIHQNDQRMLKLQSFVSTLGQRLKGKVWLLATGQQKLEEDLDGSNLSKLKDRFPPRLRVHLAPTNIRDVVHKRLLKKAATREEALRSLYQQHGASLRLYGYACDKLTETDFVEVYPLLPGYVDLIMHITSHLRARSSRMKGDDHAIRGLLQLLGEVFRQHQLGQQPLGALVTLDQIYDIQHTALDADVQNTMARLQGHEELADDPLAWRVAKAGALLQQVQDQIPTTALLVAQCLYDRVGAPNPLESVSRALEKLDSLNLLSRSDKNGYRIQSSAEQEWARERDSASASNQQLAELVKEKLKHLLAAGGEKPRLKGRPFPLAALYSDSRGARDERIQGSNDSAVLWFDFHYLTNQDERREEAWIKESDSLNRRDKLVWISGPTSAFEVKARELLRSRQMVDRHLSRVASLSEAKKAALHHEQSRRDQLDEQVRGLVAELFVEGALFFRARKLHTARFGSGFSAVLKGAAEEVLPELYQHFVDLAITDGELKQLLQPSLVGVSPKFYGDSLGLLEHDSGKVVATCKGEVPARLREYLESESGASGAALIARFGGPPWGYPPDLVRACVLGLLRGQQVQIRTLGGERITSYRDPGVQDLFLKDRDFKNAEMAPAGEQAIKPADRVKIRKFFEDISSHEIDNEPEALADAAFNHLRRFAHEHLELMERLQRLPVAVSLPKKLAELEATISKCLQSRQVESTLLALKKHLDSLRDGIQELGIYRGDLSSDLIDELRQAHRLFTVELEQLQQLGADAELEQAGLRLKEQLELPCPWRDLSSLRPTLAWLEQRYREVRAELLEKQEQQIERILEQLKLREGFARLDPEAADSVLRLVRERRIATSPQAISPALIVLRDSVPLRLREGADQAHQRLEEMLSEKFRLQVVPVRLGLANRELASPAEVEALLQELRERLLAQLKDNSRIRLL